MERGEQSTPFIGKIPDEVFSDENKTEEWMRKHGISDEEISKMHRNRKWNRTIDGIEDSLTKESDPRVKCEALAVALRRAVVDAGRKSADASLREKGLSDNEIDEVWAAGAQDDWKESWHEIFQLVRDLESKIASAEIGKE